MFNCVFVNYMWFCVFSRVVPGPALALWAGRACRAGTARLRTLNAVPGPGFRH
jgi:threonine/homoserine/homoserine lactone efflux protein